MTKISNDEVSHLASLSSLALSDQETESLRQDLDAILGYVEQLSELETTNVEPTYQVTGRSNISRSDEVIDYHISREQLLALSYAHTDESIKVPKVL